MFEKFTKSASKKKAHTKPKEVEAFKPCPSEYCFRRTREPPIKFCRLKKLAHDLNIYKHEPPSKKDFECLYDSIKCHYCQDRHTVDHYNAISKHSFWQRKFFPPVDPCWEMNKRIRSETFIHPKFNWTNFRMFMKMHREGDHLYDASLIDRLGYRSGAVMKDGQITQLTVTPKVVNGRLYMRSQTVFVLPDYEPSMMYLLDRNFLKCPHTSRLSRDNCIVAHRLFQRFAAPETISNAGPEDAMSCQCHFCATEFHISLQRFEGEGVLVFIRKWQDLGTGISDRPADLPTVVGARRIIPKSKRGAKALYESPRYLCDGIVGGKGFEAVLSLAVEERAKLFEIGRSRMAKRRRVKDAFTWKFGAGKLGSEMYPHVFGLSLDIE